jgi:hypothetical protein
LGTNLQNFQFRILESKPLSLKPSCFLIFLFRRREKAIVASTLKVNAIFRKKKGEKMREREREREEDQ